jgi:glycosyltransferase involved in cell wall biosynthesis
VPTVTVVIPTYNRKALLIEALESVWAQTFRDHEVLVVDDGSTDETERALARFKDRVRYLYKANGGVSSARNLAIREAHGSLIAFLDSDDLWESNFLQVTTAYLAQHADIAMVSTGWRTHPGGHRWPPIKAPLLHGRLLSHLMQTRMVRTSAVVARRQALLDVGLFDENLEVAEDLDMWLKIAARYPTAFLNVHLSWGRRHDERLSKNRLVHLQRQLQVLTAHYNPAVGAKKGFDRRRAELHIEMGESHLKSKNFAAAKACFKTAVNLNPFSFRARRYLLKTRLAGRTPGKPA